MRSVPTPRVLSTSHCQFWEQQIPPHPWEKKHELAQASSLHPLGDGKCPKPTPIQIVGAPSRAGGPMSVKIHLSNFEVEKKRPMISHQSNRQTQWPNGWNTVKFVKKLKVMIKHYWLPGVFFFARFVNHFPAPGAELHVWSCWLHPPNSMPPMGIRKPYEFKFHQQNTI